MRISHVASGLSLAALLLIGTLLAGCSPPPSGPALVLGSAPWQDGEQAVYDVLDRNGTKIGTSTFSFAREGDLWVLAGHDQVGQLDQTTTVRIDAGTLKPQAGEQVIHAQGTDATLRYTYANGVLEISAVVNGKSQTVKIDVPTNTLDNGQLLMTLRAAPFAKSYEARFVNLVPGRALKLNSAVRVKGQETITVPAGTFEVWRVELDFVQAKQTAWYQIAAPHQLVQYDNGSTRLVLSKE